MADAAARRRARRYRWDPNLLATTKTVTRLEKVLRLIVADLGQLGCDWALVGGLAVSAWAEPRLTRDIDLAVSVQDDSAAEALVWHLQQRRYVVRSTVEHVPTGRLGTVRLLPPGSGSVGVVVDVLFASCGIEPEIVQEAESLAVFADLSLPVARIAHLLAMKLLAFDHRQRPQDYDDLMALLGEADAVELARAEQSLQRITKLGFHRGKDLGSEFRRLLERRASSH